MSKMIAQCPSCSNMKLIVSKIECTNCHIIFEGKFDTPLLAKLSEQDLLFVIDFIKSSGSLKEMGIKHHVSYPTLRNRLNELIETIVQLETTKTTSSTDILSLIEDGKISALEAAKMLKAL